MQEQDVGYGYFAGARILHIHECCLRKSGGLIHNRSREAVVRTLINRLEAEGVFDANAIAILVGAFDDAWQTLMASGAPFAEDRYRETARLIVAKHIVELARLGERDKSKLTQAALLELSRVNLKTRPPKS